ncbi:MAG: potassium transporter Kup [Actinomycetota bacterium]
MAEPRRMMELTLGAAGVVFGDIGTSPIYTVRECFHDLAPTPGHVLGMLSLVFWALTMVVTVKYVAFVMRADNRGEGGVLALMALARHGGVGGTAIAMLGLAGAALFYGDGMITPAISVLSAIEGLEIAAPALKPWVVPAAVVVLVVLFFLQSHGTARVGRLFGPVMVLWFSAIGALGLRAVVATPQVLAAVDPRHAAALAAADPFGTFLRLGAVVLAITGAEALYADMGHFGRRPIRLAWFGLAMPALLLNYFGQGALILSQGAPATASPFFLLAPGWATWPLVGLATAATVIASQAVISGAFSLTRQAIRLGYSPRFAVLQTSEHEIGQIYVPRVNRWLLVMVVALVFAFGSSSGLASAYGIAVTGTMAVTTLMVLVVAHRVWRWPLAACVLLGLLLVPMDLAFFASNALKIPAGGWFPLAVGGVLLLLMQTWKRGRELVRARQDREAMPMDLFLDRVRRRPPLRVPGLAVFLSASDAAVPTALLHNLKHNKVLHQRIVIVTVRFEQVSWVHDQRRCLVEELSEGFHRVVVRFGFMEDTDVPAQLLAHFAPDHPFDPMETSYFISRESVIPTELPGMALWRESLFVAMVRNSAGAADFFHIPPDRAIELGVQIQI